MNVLAIPTAAPVEKARAALFLAGRSCQDRTTLALAGRRSAGVERSPPPGAAVDRISGRGRAAAGAARPGAPAPRRGVRVARVRRGPPRQRSIRPRAPREPPCTSWRSPIGACWRPRTSTSTKTSRSGSRPRAGRRSPRRSRRGKRAVDVVVRAARRGRDLRPHRPGREAPARRAPSASAAPTGSCGRARCAGRPRAASRPSPCSRWRPGRSCGSCAGAATAAGRSRR